MALIKLNTRSIPDDTITPAKVVQEGRKNLLINGGFEISQRGTYTSAASYNDGTYRLDRWETLRDGVTANFQHLVPVSGESSYGAKITATSSAAGAIRLRQRLEIPNIYKWGARTFTLSARVKSNSSNARLLMYGGSGGGYVTMTSDSNDSHTGGGAMETLTATFTTTGSVSSEFAAFVGIDNARSASDPTIASGDYFEVYDFQMEEGSHASSFENRTPAEELALCQRYFESQHFPSNDQLCVANKWSGYAYMGHMPCMVPKRSEPTVSSSGVVKHMGQAAFSGNITPAWQYMTPQGVGIYSTATSGPTGDALLVLSEGITVNIDAEL
jgi:hypothetical protein